MRKKEIILFSVLTILMLTLGCKTNESQKISSEYSTNYVEQVNSIIITPDNAESLINLLVNTFELTESWPLGVYNGTKSGGVEVGNVLLTILDIEDNDSYGISGISFLPASDFYVLKDGLESRGIDSGEPEHVKNQWTTLDIRDMLNEHKINFFEFQYTTFQNIDRNNPIKIETVSEITVNVADYDLALEKWGALFAPLEPLSPGYWEPGEGPAIKIQAGTEDKIESLQFKVKSLDTAKLFLEDKGLIGESTEDSIFTNPNLTNSILFEFKESNSPIVGDTSKESSSVELKTTFKREIEGNNMIYFENKEHNKKFDEYIPYIEEVVQETLRKTKSYYPLEYVDIFVRCKRYDWLIIPHLGVGGQYMNNHTIQVILNIDFFYSDASLKTNFERTLLHELGHLIHFKNRDRTNTLFEAIASEGIADHFEGIITGSEPEIWSRSLDKEELEKYMELAKSEFWSKEFDYHQWFFGTPHYIGYSLGYKIVGDYLSNNPDKNIIDVAKMPDKELFDSM